MKSCHKWFPASAVLGASLDQTLEQTESLKREAKTVQKAADSKLTKTSKGSKDSFKGAETAGRIRRTCAGVEGRVGVSRVTLGQSSYKEDRMAQKAKKVEL